MTTISFVEVMMTRGFKAREIELVSEARAGDRHSTVSKRETIIVAEVHGITCRTVSQAVHLRQAEDDPICMECGEHATVWYDSHDKWKAHPARCMISSEEI